MQSKQFEYLFIFIHTVFLNCLNTFSETIAQFLKTLRANLERVYHFVKTPQITALKTMFSLLKTVFFPPKQETQR